jgi:triphosphoribosyl-dephospho-CoA synthase
MLMANNAWARATRIAQDLKAACMLDVLVSKPGNVSVASPGHGMSASDFTRSAHAVSVPLTLPGYTVGERILRAVEATHAEVGCNTNLGIVLLCAPLAHAALRVQRRSTLRPELKRVLARLDLADARQAYAAIRLASPAGLGQSARHDVREEPQVGLLEAMKEAAQRDSVARQYATGFWDVFEFGVPLVQLAMRRWGSERLATIAVYLDFLAFLPDSHVARKHGEARARKLSDQARRFAVALLEADDPAPVDAQLVEWDAELKREGVNPGTSADLTVATLFAARLENGLHHEFTDGGPNPAAPGKPTWGSNPQFSES